MTGKEIFVLGGKNAVTEWLTSFLSSVARASHGLVSVGHIYNTGYVVWEGPENAKYNIFFFDDYAMADYYDALTPEADYIFALDSPQLAISFGRLHLDRSVRDSTLSLCRSMALVCDFARENRTMFLYRNMPGSLSSIVQRMLDFIFNEQISGAVETLLPADSLDLALSQAIDRVYPPTPLSEADRQDASQLTTISECAVTYLRSVLRNERIVVSWPNSIMHDADNKFQGLSKIYLTGGARILFYGPYLPLPRGEWQIDFHLRFNPMAAGLSFLVDLYLPKQDQRVGMGVFRVPHGGEFTGSLRAEIARASIAVEFRMFLMEGAIEGEMEVIDITLRQIGLGKNS